MMCNNKYSGEGYMNLNLGSTTSGTSYDQAYREAARRVKAKQGFYSHLTSYLFVNAFLIGIYLMTTPGGYPWFIWTTLGWGIGVAFHFMAVWLTPVQQYNRQRMIAEEMSRLGYSSYNYSSPSSTSPAASWPEMPAVRPDEKTY